MCREAAYWLEVREWLLCNSSVALVPIQRYRLIFMWHIFTWSLSSAISACCGIRCYFPWWITFIVLLLVFTCNFFFLTCDVMKAVCLADSSGWILKRSDSGLDSLPQFHTCSLPANHLRFSNVRKEAASEQSVYIFIDKLIPTFSWGCVPAGISSTLSALTWHIIHLKWTSNVPTCAKDLLCGS